MVVPPFHTPKWSFLVGKPMVVGETHHFRKPPISKYILTTCQVPKFGKNHPFFVGWRSQLNRSVRVLQGSMFFEHLNKNDSFRAPRNKVSYVLIETNVYILEKSCNTIGDWYPWNQTWPWKTTIWRCTLFEILNFLLSCSMCWSVMVTYHARR